MRLIDVNEALRKVWQIPYIVNENKAFHEGCRYMQKKALRILHEANTIEANPVKHGCWEKASNLKPKCSLCGEYHLFAWYDYKKCNYCPNCGAKMGMVGEKNEIV